MANAAPKFFSVTKNPEASRRDRNSSASAGLNCVEIVTQFTSGACSRRAAAQSEIPEAIPSCRWSLKSSLNTL